MTALALIKVLTPSKLITSCHKTWFCLQAWRPWAWLALHPVRMCHSVAEVSYPLVHVLGCGKNIIVGSDDEAESASCHILKIFPGKRVVFQVFLSCPGIVPVWTVRLPWHILLPPFAAGPPQPLSSFSVWVLPCVMLVELIRVSQSPSPALSCWTCSIWRVKGTQ